MTEGRRDGGYYVRWVGRRIEGMEGCEVFLLADSANSVLVVSNRFLERAAAAAFGFKVVAGCWLYGDIGLMVILGLSKVASTLRVHN